MVTSPWWKNSYRCCEKFVLCHFFFLCESYVTITALAKAIKRYIHQEVIIFVMAYKKIMTMEDAIKKIVIPNINYLKFVISNAIIPAYVYDKQYSDDICGKQKGHTARDVQISVT